METYNIFSAFGRAIIIAAPLSIALAAPARAQQMYDGSGVISAAKCPEASVFRDQSGRSYEIDNSRSSPPKNVPLRIRGKVYPRISVCKAYPWLDVAETSATNFARGETPAQAAAAKDGVVELTLERGDVGSAAPWLARLAARDEVTKIVIRIPESAAERLPNLIIALGSSAPATIAKSEISTTSSTRQVFSWSIDGQKRAFTSLSELKNALLI